jgi:hypothetical protein
LSKVIRWEVGEAGAFDRSLTPDEIWIGSTTLVDGHVVISDTSGDLISLNSVQTVGQLHGYDFHFLVSLSARTRSGETCGLAPRPAAHGRAQFGAQRQKIGVS